ncbi:hypothetical protein SADUNF_Sadunf17G0045300 [Salix dunnii]|uniref:Wall-associated receptor kinase galacturonan-binding domain-containing protein n=1 Tax=Salix dunnii TaxID=1413687 RepID=A0A835MH30_9ROSI|nr:hypothetical protein SADUNF_Sadunf17G0045300 [Salix dunnii]
MFISRISRHPFGTYAALLLLEILSTHHRCSARQITNDCAPSSCGNFRNISSPFRLNTDPGSCGDGVVELACEDNVRLTFHLNMEKYYVQAINYSDSTIRLVDPAVQKDDCFSIPHHSLTETVFYSPYFNDNNSYYDFGYKYWYEISVLAFICCENEILNPPDYIMDTSSCKNGSGTAHNSSPSCVNMEGHSYVMVVGEINDVPDLCRVNLMYTVPKNVRNISYTDVHDILADGFELQWSNTPDIDLPYFLKSFLDLFFEGIYWIECQATEDYSCGYYRYTTPTVLLSFLILFLPAILALIDTVREERHVAPAHYSMKIDSFSLLSEMVDNSYESRQFEASGYKCRISRHPFGAYAALLLLEILSTHHRCSAGQITNDCAPSSCGNFRNISSPFRLKTDRGSCGDRVIDLACEDNVRLTLHLNMVKYYVQAINYSDSTIRLVDPAVQKDDCFSIPHHSLTETVFYSPYFNDNSSYYYFGYKPWLEISVLAFICCENEILNPPDYIMDTSSCKNSSGTAQNSSPSCVNMEGHSYVMVVGEINDVPDLCRVNLMYTVSKNVRNMSYTDVHDILADGFELQWSNIPDTDFPYLLSLFVDLFFEGIYWILCRTTDVESLRMPPKPLFTSYQVQEDDYRANNAKLSDPPNDMDSSYQFGR